MRSTATIVTVLGVLALVGCVQQQQGVEQAKPFIDPVVDGESVKGYGAFAFRKSDGALRDAFNRELEEFLGSEEHLDLVAPFGFTEDQLPDGVTTVDLVGEELDQPEPAGEEPSALERGKAGEKLVIAFAGEEPYGYVDPETGAVTGEAPEIARVVLERLGIENYELKSTKWDTLIPGLQSGRFDIVAAGMYVKPDRAERVLFSNPTYAIGEAFVVAEGNPLDLHSYEDVRDNEEAVLGVVADTVEHGYAKAIGIPEDRIKVYQDNISAVAGVRAGRIDAFAGTALTVQKLLERMEASDN